MSDQVLQGRPAIVTGGASGIGASTAIEFSAAGADVVVTDIDEAGSAPEADRTGGTFAILDVAPVDAW